MNKNTQSHLKFSIFLLPSPPYLLIIKAIVIDALARPSLSATTEEKIHV